MKAKLFIIVIIIALVGTTGFIFFGPKKQETSYRNILVERGDISIEILATGTVRPENRVEIKPPISGRIEQVMVNEGDRIERGQTMAWMSSTERAALLDAARSRGDEEFSRWESLYRPTPIIAPINGTIIRRNVEAGQAFGSGGDPILVMSDRLIVRAQVDETDIAKIYSGQSVNVSLDAYSDQVIPAKVDRIAYEAETESNVTTYGINIYPSEVPDFMRSGMTANVSFIVESQSDVILIRNEAITRDQGKEFVRVRKAEEVERREIQTGLNDGLYVEVIAGLNEGETIQVPEFGLSQRRGNRRSSPF